MTNDPHGGPPEGADRAEEAVRRWYLPGWGERLRLMGWRVIYFVPLLFVLATALLVPWLVLFWWKLVVVAVALPLGAAMAAAKHALRLRKEPFCIHCGYTMLGLPDGHRCPECGVPFHRHEMEDYQRDPHWYIKRRRRQAEAPRSAAFHAGPKRSPIRRDGT